MGHLLAVQAQDPRGFRLAVRSRSSATSVSAVDALLDSGALVVSWLNRGTLHLVRAEDYWLLWALTTPRSFSGSAGQLARAGLSSDAAERAVAAAVRALSSGPVTRSVLRSATGLTGQALVAVMFHAAISGLVVRGPVVGGEHAYVLTADWLPARDASRSRESLLAELGARYVASHAPCDAADLAKWAGISLGDARRALSGVRQPGGRSAAVPKPMLLGAFDELLTGWASRAWVLGPHEGRVVRGGMFRPFALVDGRAVATWRFVRGRVVVEPLEDFDVSVLGAEVRAVERFFEDQHA